MNTKSIRTELEARVRVWQRGIAGALANAENDPVQAAVVATRNGEAIRIVSDVLAVLDLAPDMESLLMESMASFTFGTPRPTLAVSVLEGRANAASAILAALRK